MHGQPRDYTDDFALTEPGVCQPHLTGFIGDTEVDLTFGLHEDMSAENARQRLNGPAGALVSEVLESENDADTRTAEGLANDEQRGREVVIDLRDDLMPGFYVVMWRVRSLDPVGLPSVFFPIC